MRSFDLTLLVAGTLVFLLGVISNFIRGRAHLSEPTVSLAAGVLLGPWVLGVIDPTSWLPLTELLEIAATLTLAIGVMGVALRLPSGYLWRHARSVGLLLGVAMPLMFLLSSVVVHLFTDLPWSLAFLAGAVVTPTDPVVATSIVTGPLAKRCIPEPLRHVISAESGANDGLALPFVMAAVLVHTMVLGEAATHFATTTLLREVLGGVAFGAVAGAALGAFVRWAEDRKLVESTSFMDLTLALSLLTVGGARVLHVGDVLAVFAAGIAFDSVVRNSERIDEQKVQEAVNNLFAQPFFALIGASLPFAGWAQLGWSAVPLALGVLLVRRLPAVLLVRRWVPELRATRAALFAGWFGPIGVAAVYYAAVAVERTGREEIWWVASLAVCTSVLAHGVTATASTRAYLRG